MMNALLLLFLSLPKIQDKNHVSKLINSQERRNHRTKTDQKNDNNDVSLSLHQVNTKILYSVRCIYKTTTINLKNLPTKGKLCKL
jgi:hypothetical protein